MSVSCNPLKIINESRCWQSSQSWQPSSWWRFRASSCTRPARSFPPASMRGRPHQLRRTEGKKRNTISELVSWLHRYLVVRVLAKVRRPMEKSILNFHFDYLTTSLTPTNYRYHWHPLANLAQGSNNWN